MNDFAIRPPFSNDPTRACFCGRGVPFGQCCGSTASDRPPPHGVGVVSRFVSKKSCARLVKYLEQQPRLPMLVVDQEKSTKTNIVRKPDEGRVTDEVHPRARRKEVISIVKKAYEGPLTESSGRRFAWFEEPVVLRYISGGRYNYHADSDYWDAGRQRWIKAVDRDYSLLIYLNNEFTGGELHFNNFNYTHRPRRGDLVFFPSDSRYIHEAREIQSGVRYAIVAWGAFRNEPRVMDALPTPRTELN